MAGEKGFAFAAKKILSRGEAIFQSELYLSIIRIARCL
jgi:hypothetical protein